jgi:ketosteroid isomerase-like protein
MRNGGAARNRDTQLMASANLDLVRSIYADWERGDFSSVDCAHPEIEYVIADGPSPGRWTGLTGLAEGARSWMGAWEEFRIVPEEFRELDSERVLVLTHGRGRGKTSGLEMGQIAGKTADVFHIREGKVTTFVVYFDLQHASVDLGLGLEADS